MDFIKKNITKEEINQLHVMSYKGDIVLVDSQESVSAAVERIKQKMIVGIDTETRPSFQKGKRNTFKVALLQVATDDCVFLFRLNKIGLKEEVISIFQSADIVKVGLAVSGDIEALNKLCKFKAINMVDIQTVIKSMGLEVQSLQKIFAIMLGGKIAKPAKVQLSNWNADVLTDKQKEYAATDAWACIEIYNKLIELEKRKEQ